MAKPSVHTLSSKTLSGPRDFGRDLANWLFPAYLLVMLMGFLVIRQFGMNASEDNVVRALFLTINAATLTGFQSTPGLGALNALGLSVIVDLMIAGMWISMVMTSLAVVRIVRLPFTTWQIVIAATVMEVAAITLGGVLLDMKMTGERTAFEAAFLSTSAVGNCALYPSDSQRDGILPSADQPATHLIILPLTVVGGLGLPVVMELFLGFFKRRPVSFYTKTVLVMTAGIYMVSVLVLTGLHFATVKDYTWSEFQTAFRSASVLSIESRTGGLPIVPIRGVDPALQWAILVLMIMGASPAGTGGGLKTTTLAALVRGARNQLRNGYTPLPAERRAFGIALAWLGCYAGAILGAVLLFAFLHHPGGADSILFNAVSAMSNVGFSGSTVSEEPQLLFAYSAVMILGRMLPPMILWWMADTTTGADWAVG